jgi:methionyl-tRNA synthetase
MDKKYKMTEGIVEFDDWQKLDLVVGEIQQVEDIEGADKLYKLSVDIGSEVRVICAGIKEFYSHDDLRGRKCIVFINLKPRKLKGIESQGMVLAAVKGDDEKVSLLQPDADMNVGVKIM